MPWMRSSSAYSIQVIELRLTVVSVFKVEDKGPAVCNNYFKKNRSASKSRCECRVRASNQFFMTKSPAVRNEEKVACLEPKVC